MKFLRTLPDVTLQNSMVHMSYHPSFKDREHLLTLQMGRLRAREVNGLLQQAPALLIHSLVCFPPVWLTSVEEAEHFQRLRLWARDPDPQALVTFSPAGYRQTENAFTGPSHSLPGAHPGQL